MGQRTLTTQQLGQTLRLERKRVGLTQADLARRAGVLQKTVSALENRPGNCRIESLLRVLTALDLQLGLLPREEPQPRPDTEW